MTYSPAPTADAVGRLQVELVDSAERRRLTAARVAVLAIPPLCLLVGLLSLLGARASDIGAYGLVDALAPRPGYFVALTLLTVGFVIFLHSRRGERWIGLLYLLSLVVLIDGAPIVIEGTARFPTTYVHLGFTEAIMQTGHTLPLVDARFSWPGFFALSGYLSDAAGLTDPLPLARVFPVLVALLCLAAIWLLMERLLRSQVLAWLAVWLFELVDWTGQFYFAPQALALFLYLVVLLVVVVLLDPDREKPRAWRPLLLVATATFGALVVTHQLTPVILIGVLAALGALGMSRQPSLWVLFAVMFVTWFSFATAAYWAGHMQQIFGSLGQLTTTVNDNVGSRLHASPSHDRVVYVRMALSLVTWLLAGAGGYLAWRRRRLDARLVVLGAAPFVSLALQSYEGEGLIRTFLLGLPAMVGAVALLLDPSRPSRVRMAPWLKPAVLVVVLVIAIPASLVAKYGGESYESVTPGELRAATWLQDRLHPGDLVASIASEAPARSQYVSNVDYVTALDEYEAGGLAAVTELMRAHTGRRFLMLSPSQDAFGTYVVGFRPGWARGLVRKLAASPHFRLVHRDGGSRVFELEASRHA